MLRSPLCAALALVPLVLAASSVEKFQPTKAPATKGPPTKNPPSNPETAAEGKPAAATTPQ
jgi:hypothetical protein